MHRAAMQKEKTLLTYCRVVPFIVVSFYCRVVFKFHGVAENECFIYVYIFPNFFLNVCVVYIFSFMFTFLQSLNYMCVSYFF
mmetsp:Transcript_7702/g.11937  ORF Transcript_7702/g.11937 Transcript_7702/m.11937 type:complete len:82 (-) Transcript_7702:148-393(-)